MSDRDETIRALHDEVGPIVRVGAWEAVERNVRELVTRAYAAGEAAGRAAGAAEEREVIALAFVAMMTPPCQGCVIDGYKHRCDRMDATQLAMSAIRARGQEPADGE